MRGVREMKPPVPGEMVLRIWRTHDGEAIVYKALFIQHIDYPPQEWLDQQMKLKPRYWDMVLNSDQGISRGWWYVMEGDRPTYWERPHEVYVYDGNRWRRQRYEHVLTWGDTRDRSLDDLSVPNPDDDYDNHFELIEEQYLPEGEDPSP